MTAAAVQGQRARSSTGPATRLPRGRRRVAAVTVAIVILALAGFAAWQAILVQLGRQPFPLDAAAISGELNRTAWNQLAVTAVGVVLALLGLWMLILSLTPGRRKLIELREPHPDVLTGIRPADLRRALDGAAEGIDGIASSRTVLTRGTATTTVTSPLGDTTGLTEKVAAAITAQLAELNPIDPLDPRVRLSGKDRR